MTDMARGGRSDSDWLKLLELADAAPAALLVAGSEQLLAKTAAVSATLPQLEGLEYQQVAPGVVRATIAVDAACDPDEASERLRSLRRRLDAQSVASAIEWSARAEDEVDSGRRESTGPAQSPAVGGSARLSGSAATLDSETGAGLLAANPGNERSRELLRQFSDAELAGEMLRRATGTT